jgi:hypothetical protein
MLAKSLLQAAPLPLPEIERLNTVRSRATESGVASVFLEWLT